MLQRLIAFAAIVGAVYWYWAGPYQEKTHPGYDAMIKQNDENMAQCIRGASYKLGATGSGKSLAIAEGECAQKYNLYQIDGHWHSHDVARPD